MDDRTDRVRLIVEGIELDGAHGVYPEERERGNRFRIDVEIHADLRAAMNSDRLEDTIDYVRVTQIAEEINRLHRFNLIESFAGEISKRLLAEFPSIDALRVSVRKLSPPGLENATCVAAEVQSSRA